MRSAWRRFDFWASRNRFGLAMTFVALMAGGVIGRVSGVDALEVPGRVAMALSFPVLLAVFVGIRYASGPRAGMGIPVAYGGGGGGDGGGGDDDGDGGGD